MQSVDPVTPGADGRLMAARGRILVYVDLVQDIDVLLPLVLAIRDRTPWRLSIRVARWLATEAPRVEAVLHRHGLPFRYVRRGDVVAGRSPELRGIDVLLTASESSEPAHTAGWALASRAREAGVFSATLQHGFENVGLTADGQGSWARFASDRVYCWAPEPPADRPTSVDPPRSADSMPDATRAKLLHVGRPMLDPPMIAPIHDVGIFENLHWDRYDDDDRRAFLGNLLAMADSRPALSLYVRAHPAGSWLDARQGELAARANIHFAGGARARTGLESGMDAVLGVKRVITTPSTVALDAAQAGRPVALAADRWGAYAPLPRLSGLEDWLAFADGSADDGAAERFLDRALMAGDAAGRVIRDLGSIMAERCRSY